MRREHDRVTGGGEMDNSGTAIRNLPGKPPPASAIPGHARAVVEPVPARTCALILADEWRLAYRALRCAALCFDRVCILGTRRARPLARAASCHSFHDLPARRFDSSCVAIVRKLCHDLRVDVVMPGDTPTTRFLAAHAPLLGTRSYPVPDVTTFDLLNDKGTFMELCRLLDVPTPPTQIFLRKEQMLDRLREGALRLPAVAKPTRMEGNRGVKKLLPGNAWKVAASLDYAPIITQEFINGRDLCAFYLCRDGVVKAQVLYHNGGHFLEFIEHPDVARLCARIVKATSYTGVIGFDIRERDHGDLYFLECNPRFWYNMELVMLAGLNFVELGLADAAFRQASGLAGKVMVRPVGLLRRSPDASNGLASRLTVLGYLADDFPMMVSIALSKFCRMTLGSA